MGTNVFLTQNELYKLRLTCANPFLELGSTMQPEHLACLTKHEVEKTVRVAIRFPTPESADKWNDLHGRRTMRAGHAVTVVLAYATFLATRSQGIASTVGISAGAAIAKDELQAKVWFPRVQHGQTLTRRYDFRYEQFSGRELRVSWVDLVSNEHGTELERKSHGPFVVAVGGESGVPLELVGQLLTSTPSYIHQTFQ